MERKLASIQKVKNLFPIPDADKIEVAEILGWKVVVKKGEYNVGDLICYVEIDSVLPQKPEFEFLRDRHFRIKTVKLRKQVSQGIVFPLSILPAKSDHVQVSEHEWNAMPHMWQEDEDVTEVLGIKKYEPDVPAQLAGTIKGSFPSFLHKTDETRIQSIPQILENFKDTEMYVTEKLDGSSMTVYLRGMDIGGEFGVCSRNLDIKESAENAYWKTARALDLETKMRTLGKNICLQGELVGPGVQKNKYALSELAFYIFNIFDIDTQKYYDFEDFLEVVATLGLKCVPVVHANLKLTHTVDELVKMADNVSVLNPNVKREGLVFRSRVEKDEPIRGLGRFSFKVINPEFLLKYGE